MARSTRLERLSRLLGKAANRLGKAGCPKAGAYLASLSAKVLTGEVQIDWQQVAEIEMAARSR